MFINGTGLWGGCHFSPHNLSLIPHNFLEHNFEHTLVSRVTPESIMPADPRLDCPTRPPYRFGTDTHDRVTTTLCTGTTTQ